MRLPKTKEITVWGNISEFRDIERMKYISTDNSNFSYYLLDNKGQPYDAKRDVWFFRTESRMNLWIDDMKTSFIGYSIEELVELVNDAIDEDIVDELF